MRLIDLDFQHSIQGRMITTPTTDRGLLDGCVFTTRMFHNIHLFSVKAKFVFKMAFPMTSSSLINLVIHCKHFCQIYNVLQGFFYGQRSPSISSGILS